ncbi:class I SAM-dependent methyltransferase [Allosphingosinicella sp.]|jgi:predicted methyltransferase|uniref:class I SAM-dependent methyltransferase n=1 Tax=Allosphingosinicella sp. TaxID=2823234 RepID=UPI002EE3D5CF
MLKRALLLLALGAMAPASAQTGRAPIGETELRAAVAAPGRPEAAVALDEVRKPAEILRFMGLRRGDRVLDYFTGTGYYADIMARAVGPGGLVVGWNGSGFMANPRVRTALDEVHSRNSNTYFYGTPTTALAFPPASFDFAMLHLVYHDAYWEAAQYNLPRIDPNTVVQALWHAVRRGGTVAVIDHVGPSGDTRAVVQGTHRIDPAVVRADFERAGFVLEAQSEMLRNPQDDLSVNVFEPSIRGRTDRIVYRFRKPR